MVKEEGISEDWQSLGRNYAIDVKVEYERPKTSPYVFVKKDMGNNDFDYYGSGNTRFTEVKNVKQEFLKKVFRVITQEPVVIKGLKNELVKMKAPSEEDPTDYEEAKGSEDGQVIQEEMKDEWTEDHLAKAYHRNKMKKFVLKDPVMQAFKVKV